MLNLNRMPRIPTRFKIALMILCATFMNYSMRSNLSVSIVAMAPRNVSSLQNHSQPLRDSYTESSQQNTEPSADDTFEWSEKQQAHVLSAYYYGYTITTLIGGTVAERWGPRKVIFITTIINAILTLISPWSARISFEAFFAVRLGSGTVGGFTYPSVHVLVAHWAPPDEKGKFVCMQQGGMLGTTVTWALSGPIIQALGWDYTFYIPGIVTIFWCAIWWYTVYDSSAQHPRISSEEAQYIAKSIGDHVNLDKNVVKVTPPFTSILSSFPFLAMVILHFGTNWGLQFLLLIVPKYVSSVLMFSTMSAGFMSSLPNLAKLVFAGIFGIIGDRLVKSNIIQLKLLRRLFCITSHILPGLLIIGLGYTSASPYLSVAMFTLSMALNGSTIMTNLANHHDLAPNFAGTLYGIANSLSNTTGFIVPLVTAHFLKDGNGFDEWRPIFLVGGMVSIVAAVHFILFASTEVQPWNYK